MATSEHALEQTAAYLMARAAGKSPAPLSLEVATEAVAFILDVVLPEVTGRDLVAAIRAATVADDVSFALAGQPASVVGAADILRDAQLRGEVQHRILQERLLDAEAAATVLGSQAETNLRQYANLQRQRGDLLGVPRLNTYLYPEFQFDLARRCIHETVCTINQLLDAKNDPWGVASWWTTPSERLRHRAPKELLGTEEESVLVHVARAELAPVG
jgi:hypothetical protein